MSFDSTTRTTVMLTMIAAAATRGRGRDPPSTGAALALTQPVEHARLEPGRRFGFGRELRDHVGRFGELGDVGLAARAAVDVQQHLGALGAAQDPQGQLRRELSHLGTRQCTDVAHSDALLAHECSPESQQRGTDSRLGRAQRDVLDLPHFACGVAEQTREHDGA